MADLKVKLKGGSYPIIIGTNLDKRLLALVKKHAQKNKIFVLFDSNVYALYGKRLESRLKKTKVNFHSLVIPAGEKSKSDSELNKIYDFLLSQQISRSDFILAVGGGVLTDIAGYAAATTMRGISWGAVSTTLLGMVDAAIGGKTGINHNRGKNLVGAFWQPSFVLCDLDYLNTLPPGEIIAGMGEVLKYAGLIGTKTINQLTNYMKSSELFNFKKLKPFIELGAKYKAKIVAQDERESNKRMVLNLGHTFAHAIEKSLGYGRLLHGEAVIIGLLAAVKLSQKHNTRAKLALGKYEELIKTFIGFVRYYPVNANRILDNMKLDKKRNGTRQKFVLLRRPGQPFIASGLNSQNVKEALLSALAFYKKAGAVSV